MADFCFDCYKFMFGNDMGECDLAGLITKEEMDQGFVVRALCEGCGVIQIDYNGQKIPWTEKGNDVGQWENEGGQ